MSVTEIALSDQGQLSAVGPLHQTWKKRKDSARRHRRQFERVWVESQYFAAGKQWLQYNELSRTWRTLKLAGQERQTHDVLLQNLWTVIGALAADDFRPQFLFEHDDEEGHGIAEYVNDALGYGWESEWDGDSAVFDLLLNIAVYGTAGLRCRYDRTKGALVGNRVPMQNGRPILDQAQGHQYLEERLQAGQEAQFGSVREGQVVWEVLSPWNILPPPGVARAQDFRWEIVVRPVPLEEIKASYGAAGATVQPEALDSMDVRELSSSLDVGKSTGTLEDHALVYTGTEKPSSQYPDGQTFVFTDTAPLDFKPSLPYPETPSRSPSSGIVYFGYWPVPGQFWNRGFIEPGIGPQKTLNKRETQVDQIIDRSMPWLAVPETVAKKWKGPTGRAMEIVPYPDQQQLPVINSGMNNAAVGALSNDIERLKESVSDALGLKQIALGENPPGVVTYSQLALLKEAELTKLGPISKRFRIGLAEISVYSLEAMKQWPPGKKLAIVSDEDKLKVIQWAKERIPAEFQIRPAKGASQPRSLGAELSKVDDLWNAALTAGLVAQKPAEWFDWFRRSKEAGKSEEPPEAGVEEQHHKAELENLAMIQGSGPLPVAPYDNAAVHVPVHEAQGEQLSQLLNETQDERTAQALQSIQAHIQMHLQQGEAGMAPSSPQVQPPGAVSSPAPGTQ